MGLLVLDIAMMLPGGGRVSYGNVVGVDVVRALVVVHGDQLDAAEVV